MFNNLKDFSYKRSSKEAIGFYLAYLGLALLLGIILGVPAILTGIIDINNYVQLTKIAAYFSGTYCGVISILLLTKKKFWNNLGYILLALLGILLAVGTGVLLGLVIPALITTKALTAGQKETTPLS